MIKMLSVALLVCFSMSVSEPAHANSPLSSAEAGQMVQLITQRMKQNDEADCQDETALACLKISQSKCLATKSDVLNMCIKPLLEKLMALSPSEAEESEMDMAQCAYDVAVDKHKIDPKKYMECVGNDANESTDAIMQLLLGD